MEIIFCEMFFIVVTDTEEQYGISLRICELSCGVCSKFQNKAQANMM